MTSLPTAEGFAALRRYMNEARLPSDVRAWVTASPLAMQQQFGSAVMLWAVEGPRGSKSDDAANLAAILTEAHAQLHPDPLGQG